MQIHYVFWLLQFLFLFCYSISGLWKVQGFGLNLFEHDTLAIRIMARSIESDGQYMIWQGLAASYPGLVQALHVCVVFIQLSSLLVFFLPHFYVTYGILLIFFHFGTSYLLTISFIYHIFIWSIFFIFTPLTPKRNNLVLILHSIPVFGVLFRKTFAAGFPSAVPADSMPVIVYDGDCPFCRNYVAYMRLRIMVGPVTLVNARSEGAPIIAEIKQRGLSLDDGIVFIYKDHYYHGADAMRMITRLSEAQGLAAAMNHLFFSNKTVSRMVYPVFRAGRNITLRVLGRRKLA